MNADEILANNIAARNKVNAYAMEAYDVFYAFFKQYEGKDVLNQNNTFRKNINSLLPKFREGEKDLRFRVNPSYIITLDLDVTYKTSEFSVGYEDCSVCIAKQTFEGLSFPYSKPDLRTDYALDDIMKTRMKINEKMTEVRHLQASISPFNDRLY